MQNLIELELILYISSEQDFLSGMFLQYDKMDKTQEYTTQESNLILMNGNKKSILKQFS